jgi:homoserine O-acetyltransferase
MFDTNRFCVICSNVIGGCMGSSGPASIAPDGKPYGLRFPLVTVADMVAAQRHLLDYLGVETLFAAAGGSMGGMQALQWAVDYPNRVRHVLFIAATARSSTQNIAFNAIGREAIYADPRWNNGDYYDSAAPPNGGLAVARMVGHITYMSENSLEAKFGRRLRGFERLPYQFGVEFEIESYLRYQGEKFYKRFDPNSYLYITKALDYFDIGAGFPTMADALTETRASFLVISFSSDWLYTADQARELVEALEQVGRDVQYRHIHADFGHDSFLVEVDTMTTLVGGYLRERWEKFCGERDRSKA